MDFAVVGLLTNNPPQRTLQPQRKKFERDLPLPPPSQEGKNVGHRKPHSRCDIPLPMTFNKNNFFKRAKHLCITAGISRSLILLLTTDEFQSQCWKTVLINFPQQFILWHKQSDQKICG